MSAVDVIVTCTVVELSWQACRASCISRYLSVMKHLPHLRQTNNCDCWIGAATRPPATGLRSAAEEDTGTVARAADVASRAAAPISSRWRHAFFIDVGLVDFIPLLETAGSPAVGDVCSNLTAEQLRAVACIASWSDRSSAFPLIVRHWHIYSLLPRELCYRGLRSRNSVCPSVTRVLCD